MLPISRATPCLRPMSSTVAQQVTGPGEQHASIIEESDVITLDTFDWARLPEAMRMRIASRLSARDLVNLSSTCKDNFALGRTPTVIYNQRRDDATRSLWHLAQSGDAEGVRQLLNMTNPEHFDWNKRNQYGETLLMDALGEKRPLEVINALSNGPSGLFAGLDRNGCNILHHVVTYGDERLLERLLSIRPELTPYIDLPGLSSPTVRQTPLEYAYHKYDDALFIRLARAPMETIEKLFDASDKSRPETKTTHNATLTDVFPFDRNGKPLAAQDVRQRRGALVTPRAPLATRLDLVADSIKRKESEMLKNLLSSLPMNLMQANREAMIKHAMDSGHFASVRAVAKYYQAALFSPLSDGSTVLHFATQRCGPLIFEWLLEQADETAAWKAVDNNGRTPMLSAAYHQNAACLAILVRLCPDPIIHYVDKEGHGLLHTIVDTAPAMAIKLDYERWLDRIPKNDKTATLVNAIDNVRSYRQSGNSTLRELTDFDARLHVVQQLLLQPRGQIDLEQISPSTGQPILQALKSRQFSQVASLVARHMPASLASPPPDDGHRLTVLSRKKPWRLV